MTIALTLHPNAVIGPDPLDRTLSDDGKRLSEATAQATEFSNSIGIGEPRAEVELQLWEALEDASIEGWDGYGARAGSLEAVAHALRFLRQLPTRVPPPEVAIDKDGDAAIEWHYGSRMQISVRVTRDGTIFYAGVVGHSKFYGTEVDQEGIPPAVAEAVERVFKAAGAW